ncbi:MAG TPA: hypothetical protein VNS58_16160 [Puia sp.]|nr:hypothetical protein [Puia sp.]
MKTPEKSFSKKILAKKRSSKATSVVEDALVHELSLMMTLTKESTSQRKRERSYRQRQQQHQDGNQVSYQLFEWTGYVLHITKDRITARFADKDGGSDHLLNFTFSQLKPPAKRSDIKPGSLLSCHFEYAAELKNGIKPGSMYISLVQFDS